MPHRHQARSFRSLLFALVSVASTCALIATRPAGADVVPFSFDPLVRVHLAQLFDGSESLTFSNTTTVTAAMTVAGNAPVSDQRERITDGSQVTVEGLPSSASVGHHDGIFVDGLCSLSPGQSITLSPPDITADQVFTILRSDGKPHRYRGSLRIIDQPDGTLRVINSLLLEDYLKGVVGPEMGSSAPLEALKAQAVAARTYAIKNFGKCIGDGGDADLDDTTRCQNYRGYDAENWRCRTAVDETTGKIITYDDNPIDAVYATDCGGETADGGVPYLKPVADTDCGAELSWTISVTLSDLIADLEKVGIEAPPSISNIDISDKDDSGRVTSLTIEDQSNDRHIVVSGVRLREALGYDHLRSTLFSVVLDQDAQCCVFTGRGWGHGLGMCQQGAVDMARVQAATYEQILKHYYTGVELSDLTSDFLQEDSDTTRDVADLPAQEGKIGTRTSTTR